MVVCSRCNTEIAGEPYRSISNEGQYCSEECLPESAFDHPYSYEYIKLLSLYRHFQERKQKVDSFEERVDLENEMDLVIEEYKSLFFGDSEGSFYKSKK
ncbi:hypothetical protein M4D70_15735 [Brevibacillus borstelensis]|uniref:hypothetical protein n=1 Tax=Brevibacillus borstelensis TaxID=45462 RepID=UPI00203B81EA|nr:hypothetical protein [Brevibacillus borstelensis]MCM3623685.1 hypothetical protein [Brevibacillus borstelensis]